MSRKLIALASLLVLAGCNQQQPAISSNAVEIHYAPFENLEHIDVATLAQAQHTIDLAAYALTDFAVADALTSAANRGVHIRIYRDQVQTLGEQARAEKQGTRRRKASEDLFDADDTEAPAASQSVLARLAATPNIQLRIKHSRTLMHLKSYAVDGTLLRTGSANFSPTGEKRQDNDLILMHDSAAAQHFTQNFDLLWQRADNESLEDLRAP